MNVTSLSNTLYCYRSLSEDELVKKRQQLCPQESDDTRFLPIPLRGVGDDLPHPVIFEEGKEVFKLLWLLPGITQMCSQPASLIHQLPIESVHEPSPYS